MNDQKTSFSYWHREVFKGHIQSDFIMTYVSVSVSIFRRDSDRQIQNGWILLRISATDSSGQLHRYDGKSMPIIQSAIYIGNAVTKCE